MRLLRESHARELAPVLGLSLSGAQKALASLDRDGLVAARPVGRARLFRIDPRAFARADLERYLDRLLEPEAALRLRASGLRRRPRGTGKPL